MLAAFTTHCRDELDDVEVVAAETARLVVRWRQEESRFELRNGFLGVDRLASATPTMLLGDTERDLDGLVTVFLDRPELRSKLAVCDLGRLERLGTVRSSSFVYFEWFLRDAYGVKLLPVQAFTQGSDRPRRDLARHGVTGVPERDVSWCQARSHGRNGHVGFVSGGRG